MDLMLRHPSIPESVWAFLSATAASDSVDALILFGSRAFGDHDERSDIDIAISAPSMTRLEWARIRDSARRARSLYWISPVHLERNPPALRDRIRETGITIYVRPQTSGQPEQSAKRP